ncbi:MAG: hypothetical protein IH891_11300 [Planctomycetes bacterium]|nr:hypothetical protein [Planctomycetota bacterium]
MKVKHITSLAALAGASMFVGTAQAGFVWLEAVEIFASQTAGSASGSPASHGLRTFRIFAVFTGVGTDPNGDANQLVFVGADPENAGLLIIPAVFEHGGSNADYLPPNLFFVQNAAGLEWDSYSAIGMNSDGTGINPFAPTPDFGGVTGGLLDWSGGVNDDNSGWFTEGPAAQGLAIASPTSTGFGVFIAQLSFAGAIGGDFIAATQDGLGIVTINTAIIPTPGALALLGLAGLAGIRRRRRA